MTQKSSLNKTILIACISIFFLVGLLTTIAAEAASVTLAWNANSPTPNGYRLFVRRNDQLYDYSRPAWQGSTLRATINNLQEQTDYYFVVRAFDGTRESGNSNELRYVTPATENSTSTPPNNNYGSDTTAPYWDGATLGIGSVMAGPSEGQVTIEFDTARDGTDGRSLRFNVYYAPSASWDNQNWSGNSVIADATVRTGDTFAHAVTINGLTNGVRYTFGVRAEDRSGNEDANTTTLRATPSAAALNNTGDTIIDNRSSQTSQTGWWSVSTGSNAYDRDSVWSRNGSTFTWYFTPSQSGVYDVLMWWTERSSRSTRIPVNITHAHGTATVHVNQLVNGGRWNSQGQFQFQAGTTYRVTITAQPWPSTTCADAVRFVPINESNPVGSVQPETAETATIADYIIDNRSSQTSQTGWWSVSTGSNAYDRDSVWSRNGSTFTWHFTPSQSGVYDVSMWWTTRSSRSTRIPVNITHAHGTATVHVNQLVNGGRWNSQGQYQFQAGTTYRVTITAQPGPSTTCADAVRFQLVAAK